MKKFLTLFAGLVFIALTQAQTVGIGTTTPNNNAILDIFSNSKGFLIPRIGDTGIVTNPLEGMIIYNKNTKTPYYHDGTKWISLGGRFPNGATTLTDRITYQITGGQMNGAELDMLAGSFGLSYPEGAPKASVSSFTFMKESDINTKEFNRAGLLNTHYPSIEIKYYASGAMIPYASQRLQNVVIESWQMSVSAGGGSIVESISLTFVNYGFKDWVNGLEFGFNVQTNSLTSY